MRKTKLPLSEFGLTTRHWKPAVFEGILGAFLLFWVVFTVKYTIIKQVPIFNDVPVFEFYTGINRSFQIESWRIFATMIFFILFSPLQEFLIRGGLQSALFSFFPGEGRKTLWMSIIVSNLMFAAFHAHISPSFSLSALIPGIMWGWLYSRHKTLIGVSISHALFGVATIFILGASTIMPHG